MVTLPELHVSCVGRSVCLPLPRVTSADLGAPTSTRPRGGVRVGCVGLGT